MEEVEERVKTFVGWPLRYLPARKLAEAGFVFLGHDDAVRCHSCCQSLREWEVGEEPWEEHARHFPSCLFVQSKRPDVLQAVQGSLENRRTSFHKWPVNTICREQLAKAGFFYSGVRDEVTCHCCLVTLHVGYWKAGDDVWEMHFKYSPGCMFVLQQWPRVREKMDSELHRFCSFTKWPKKGTVAVPKLVAAGFFYTGVSDQVRCYSCQGTLKLWEPGDQPHTEHARHFPQCFLSRKQGGEIGVDPHDLDSVTPKSDVAVRLATFWNWPPGPTDAAMLAAAGFVYTGTGDEVRCFSCSTVLSKWEPNDHPWVEHLRHVPFCCHVLSRAPVSVLLRGMHTLDERLSSFVPWAYPDSPVAPQLLAEAGFFYCQTSDRVRCFSCGVILYRWEPGEDPWNEHYRHSPQCPFVRQQRPSSSSQGHRLDTAVVSQLVGMGFTHEQIEQVAHQLPAFSSYTLEQRVDALLACASPSNDSPDAHQLVDSDCSQKSQQTVEGSSAQNHDHSASESERLLCKVCMDAEVSVLFTPCGHITCCERCAPPLKECPICRNSIQGRVRAILS